MNERIVVAPHLERAIASGEPVVALETTVITHGLPPPQGLETALALEEIVRAGGARPATIGVLAGSVFVGLTRDQLTRLAGSERVTKLNPSNLGAGLASGEPGSTTVAATVLIAARAGIRVLATGGIGGVHRDAPTTFDVSADLVTLTRTPVAVVCAGAKAVLDLPRTVEMLETLGVPIFGLDTDELPAFYRRSSGLAVDRRFATIEALAAAVRAHWGLGLRTGVVVGNPIPAEFELPLELHDRALAQTLDEAARSGVRGRDLTPFLLERMRERTEGESVFSNRALLEHNARVAAALAVELARLAR